MVPLLRLPYTHRPTLLALVLDLVEPRTQCPLLVVEQVLEQAGAGDVVHLVLLGVCRHKESPQGVPWPTAVIAGTWGEPKWKR